jgi:hypothetical protein
VVDQHTGIEAADLRDGVHPSDAGDRKMTERWYPVLVKAIDAFKSHADIDNAQTPLSFDL